MKTTQQNLNANKRRRKYTMLSGTELFLQPQQCAIWWMLSVEVLPSTSDANIFSWDDPCANCTHHPGSVRAVLHPLSLTQPFQQSRKAMKTSFPGYPVGLALACRLAAAQQNAGEKKHRKKKNRLDGSQMVVNFWPQLVRFSALVNPLHC